MAAGSLNGITFEKCQVLKNRNVILFPDQGAFEKWELKAMKLRLGLNQAVFISDLIEQFGDKINFSQGFDLADFIIE